MIYKLKYLDKQKAIQDLTKRGVFNDASLILSKGNQAVVFVGRIIIEDATYNEDGEELTAPIFEEGYFVDVMSDIEIDFSNQVFPEKVAHKFAGND